MGYMRNNDLSDIVKQELDRMGFNFLHSYSYHKTQEDFSVAITDHSYSISSRGSNFKLVIEKSSLGCHIYLFPEPFNLKGFKHTRERVEENNLVEQLSKYLE